MTLLAASASGGDVTPGVLGFLVVAAMGLALFFLLRSMNAHLRKVQRAADRGGQDERAKAGQPPRD